MKFIKIAMVFLLTFTITGCDSLPMFQATETPRPTIDPALPTNTRWVFQTETPEMTETPKPIIPTFAPPAGWQKIEGDKFEIYLPGSYKGGSTDENIEQLIENFHSMGADYKWYADTLYQYPDIYKMMCVDTKKGSAGFITHTSITYEPALPAFTIESAMSAVSSGLPQGYQIVDNDLIEINQRPAGQIVVKFQSNNKEGKEIIYLIKGDTAVWTITFATGEEEYNTRLVEFIQIIDSFRITAE